MYANERTNVEVVLLSLVLNSLPDFVLAQMSIEALAVVIVSVTPQSLRSSSSPPRSWLKENNPKDYSDVARGIVTKWKTFRRIRTFLQPLNHHFYVTQQLRGRDQIRT
jgi:hypothetical protein